VRYYTRESGVRNLEREDRARSARKVVKEIALGRPEARRRSTVNVTSKNLDKYLGVRVSTSAARKQENEIGLVTGLAWTEVGGDLLQIESTLVPGKGQLILTGQLGDVMKESASAALSVVRARTDTLRHRPGLPAEARRPPARARRRDAEGRPERGHRDGDRAGVDADQDPGQGRCGDDGEITLRGKVLRIGGLKEKLLAAHARRHPHRDHPRGEPQGSRGHPEGGDAGMKIVPVTWIDEVLDLAWSAAVAQRPGSTAGAQGEVVPPRAPARSTTSRTDPAAGVVA
jgi:ATP-dependent Lon protease